MYLTGITIDLAGGRRGWVGGGAREAAWAVRQLLGWVRAGAGQTLGSIRQLADGGLRPRLPGLDRASDLLFSLEAADGYTAGHCVRVGTFASLIAEELGICGRRRRDLLLAATLHDVGKMDVPAGILQKDSGLDASERTIMEGHVEAGERRAARFSKRVRMIIAQHHERIDGRGYPRQLAGEEICLEARVVAVADAFDAMTSNRSYRRARSPWVALDELRRCAQPGGATQQFDTAVVEALARRIDDAAAVCEPPAPAAAAA